MTLVDSAFRQVEELRAVMVAHGDAAKQLWLTEFGWDACPGGPIPVGYEYCALTSEGQQADYTLRAIAYARAHWPWVGALILWNLNYAALPGIAPDDEKVGWSLLRADGSPRPALVALAAQHALSMEALPSSLGNAPPVVPTATPPARANPSPVPGPPPSPARPPVVIAGTAGARAMASGAAYALAVAGDGTLQGWGDNDYGQVGDGTTTGRAAPVGLDGPAGVAFAAVAPGVAHSLALAQDGTIWAWGRNDRGQLGDGTLTDAATPFPVSTPGGFAAVAAGQAYSVAVARDGTVWTWGDNFYGELGDGTRANSAIPRQLAGPDAPSGIVAVATGRAHTLALARDGTLWSWGDNGYGQLGDGTTTDASPPLHLTGPGAPRQIVAVAAGPYSSLALARDGTLWGWGYNGFGQLGGDPSCALNCSLPVHIDLPVAVTAIAAGTYHSLAVAGDGTVWTWGGDGYGQLGDGTTGPHAVPLHLTGPTAPSGIATVAAGSYHSLALASDGRIWAWGDDRYGQLGTGAKSGVAPRAATERSAGTP